MAKCPKIQKKKVKAIETKAEEENKEKNRAKEDIKITFSKDMNSDKK